MYVTPDCLCRGTGLDLYRRPCMLCEARTPPPPKQEVVPVKGRTIELRLGDEFLKALSDGGVGPVDKRLTDAVGYLSLWAFGGRATLVQIYGDRRGELTARYTDENGQDVYTIGAVPDENWNYSFHS